MAYAEFDSLKIPGTVDIVEGSGGLPLVRVTNAFAECDIYTYGAHVARFVPAGGRDMLWMSPTSRFEAGIPIRGGIPVCFPWFGFHESRSDLPPHGFVRTRIWDLTSAAQLSGGETRLTFRTGDDEETRRLWPYAFSLELAVTVGRELELVLTTENTGTHPFRYDDCLHTYFAVEEAGDCEIRGLEDCVYLDRVTDRSRIQSGPLAFPPVLVNDTFIRSPGSAELHDRRSGRIFRVRQSGFGSSVVWNPGPEAGAKNDEIGAAWNRFVCLESVNCMDARIQLLPGTAHISRTVLSESRC